jgi:Family of unknown function (DUF6069)
MGPMSAGRAAIVAVIASVVVTLVIYFVAKAALEIHPAFAPLMTPLPTILFTIIGVGVGAGVYSLLRRRGGDTTGTFMRIALLALLASFIPDVALLATGQPGATLTSVGVLVVMHVVAAVVAIAVLTRAGGSA